MLISRAWQRVKTDTIKNCFSKARMFDLEYTNLNQETVLPDITEWHNFQSFYEMDIDFDEYSRSDKNLITRNNELSVDNIINDTSESSYSSNNDCTDTFDAKDCLSRLDYFKLSLLKKQDYIKK
ncbi:hypothetical protein A3Q56_07103 [Intoshia linei]|uniref:DDE-1 domain-containing protein n=1 Tax=Intoshia linei TaxID=1819745 RepID=A0A177AT62_9BILA|nr:hypothetical protein A3Q56_07103 [Intoshia linei]